MTDLLRRDFSTLFPLQAITFLQSAARLKGTEEITEEDILEIAGVSPVASPTCFNGRLFTNQLSRLHVENVYTPITRKLVHVML